LIEYASHPVSGTKGFRLTISRFRDRSGLELHAEFSPGESPEPSSLAQATISSMRSFSRSHNSGPLADWADPKMWKLIGRKITAAQSASPDPAFVLLLDFQTYPEFK
jgi:hypothetical protein